MTLLRGDWFFVVLIIIDSMFMARPYIYAIQQDNYRLGTLFKTKRIAYVFLIDLLAVAVFSLIWTLFYFLQSREFWGFATAMFFFITEFALYFMEDLPDKKKPLRYTKRAVRGMVAATVCGAAAETLLLAYVNGLIGTEVQSELYMRYLIFFAYPFIFPVVFIAAISAVNVFERLNNSRYERRTRQLLSENPELIKIAVTGSYAKTSVKNALYEMLKRKYEVVATPESYNTPMGISKAAKLIDVSTEIFIAEMGARRKGDIKKLMEIVNPTHSVLTGLNVQHLETFGSEENIVREKAKVITMLKGDGFAIANDRARDKLEGALSQSKRARQPIYVGERDGSDIKIADIAVCESGSVFKLEIEGDVFDVYTPLLGAHNIENIAVAAAAAFCLGVSIPDILAAAATLEPVPHRMQLIDGGGIRIIDDTFNSNPDGAKCALDVLAMFSGRKVIVTPGLVELGSAEYEQNYKLGEEIAAVCDAVMLIGAKRTEAIRRALKQSGFEGSVTIYRSLKEAEEAFSSMLHVGDALLLLNDLPDCYDE